MIAYRYEVKFPPPDPASEKEPVEKQTDFYVIVLAPNGETAKTALKQQFAVPGIEFNYQSQTAVIIQAQ